MPVGLDGVAVLLLSVAVAVGTAGGSLALAVVVWTAWRAPTSPGPCAAVAVLGHRLDVDGRPAAAFRQRLQRARAVAAHGAMLHVLGGVTRPPFPSEGDVGRGLLLARIE